MDILLGVLAVLGIVIIGAFILALSAIMIAVIIHKLMDYFDM